MTLASRALLRGSDSCSRPADGRKQRCELERTRGVRYRVAAMLVGERLSEWHDHIVFTADPWPWRRFPGLPAWTERLEPLHGPSYDEWHIEPSNTWHAGCAVLHIL